jgi:uncharacterized protein (DUF2141 family)
MKMLKMTLPMLLLSTIALGSLVNDCRAATVSGTVTYGGGMTGRIHLIATGNNFSNQPTLQNCGVSIAEGETFSISGLQTGTYTIRAFMDTAGSGTRHANDPATPASSPVTVTIASASEVKTGVVVTLSDRSPAVALSAPAELNAVRGNNGMGAFVNWKMPADDNGLEIPTSYTISWSANSSGSSPTSQVIPATGGEMWLHYSSVSTAYYYRVTAHLGGSSASTGWVQAQTMDSGTHSISGSVTYTGVTPIGRQLFVAAIPPDGAPQAIGIATSTADATSFTIPMSRPKKWKRLQPNITVLPNRPITCPFLSKPIRQATYRKLLCLPVTKWWAPACGLPVIPLWR